MRAARSYAEALHTGLARSRQRGLGLEYVDFRDYSYGDDVRFVDWRLTARTVTVEGDYRLVVKVFQAERRTEPVFVADMGWSMGFGEKPWMLAYTLTLLAGLAESLEDLPTLILLSQGGSRVYRLHSPWEAPARIEALVCRGGAFSGGTSLVEVAQHHARLLAGRPVVAVTDYARTPLEVTAFLRRLRVYRSPVMYVALAGFHEINQPVDGGLVAFRGGGSTVLCRVEDFYRAVRRHVARLRSIARVFSTVFVEAVGRAGMRSAAPRIVEGYLHVRSTRGIIPLH